jgi:hypothetical protein
MINIEKYLRSIQHVCDRREMYLKIHLEDMNGNHRELRRKFKDTIRKNHKQIEWKFMNSFSSGQKSVSSPLNILMNLRVS